MIGLTTVFAGRHLTGHIMCRSKYCAGSYNHHNIAAEYVEQPDLLAESNGADRILLFSSQHLLIIKVKNTLRAEYTQFVSASSNVQIYI
jgi:uncharacterized membrane protein